MSPTRYKELYRQYKFQKIHGAGCTDALVGRHGINTIVS